MRALRLCTVAALLAASSLSTVAWAAPTAKDRAEAKARAAEGRKKMKDKRWAEAVVALKKAEKLDPTPALALEVAQAQIGAGKLVEARKTLTAVAEGSETAPAARKARANAKKALADLKDRVPTMTVKVNGAPPARVSILLDGVEVEGTDDIPVNPGDHTVGAAADGFASVEKDFHFDEAAHPRITLDLVPVAARPVVEAKRFGFRVPGAVLTTVGGLGLVAGGIFGGLAFAATSSAKSQCVGNTCPPSAADDISRSKTFGNVSTGLFIGGGAVAVTGIILLIAAPGGGAVKSDEGASGGQSARLTGLAPWVGAGSGGLAATGSF